MARHGVATRSAPSRSAAVHRDAPMCARYLFAYSFIEAATSGLVGLTVIYMTAQLCVEDVGGFLVISLVFIIIIIRAAGSKQLR